MKNVVRGFLVFHHSRNCGQSTMTNCQIRSGSAALVAALATIARFPIYATLTEESGLIRSWTFTKCRCGLKLYHCCNSLFNISEHRMLTKNYLLIWQILWCNLHDVRYCFYPTLLQVPSSTKYTMFLIANPEHQPLETNEWIWIPKLLEKSIQLWDQNKEDLQHNNNFSRKEKFLPGTKLHNCIFNFCA